MTSSLPTMCRDNGELLTEPPMPEGLTEKEEMIFDAFRNSALGREGKLQSIFFQNVWPEFQSLLDKGIIHEIPATHHYRHLPNHPYYGIVGEEYPETEEDWSWFRHTGLSWNLRYCEFKEMDIDREKLSADTDEVFRIIQEDVVEDGDVMNDYTKNKFLASATLAQYAYENDTVDDAADQFLAEWATVGFFDLKPKDKDRMKKILEMKIEFNSREIAREEAELEKERQSQV